MRGISANPTYLRPQLNFRHYDDPREKALTYAALQEVEVAPDALARLRAELTPETAEDLLRYFFQERKFDARVQDYVIIIRGFFIRSVVGKDDEGLSYAERVGFDSAKLSEEKFQQFGKLLITFEAIILSCQSDQQILELVNSADKFGERLYDLIELALTPLSETDLPTHLAEGIRAIIVRQEERKRLAEAEGGVSSRTARVETMKRGLPLAEAAARGATADAAADVALDPENNPTLFIGRNYTCELVFRESDMKLTHIKSEPDPGNPTKESMNVLIESLLGLSDYEGEITRTSRGHVMSEPGFQTTLTIENPSSFYVCLDNSTKKKLVKTTNNFLNLIYQLGVVRHQLGEAIIYQDLVTEALSRFTPTHPLVAKELESRLRHAGYDMYFSEAMRCHRGFNFDYCPNDSSFYQTVEETLAAGSSNIETAMTFIIYGDDMIAGNIDNDDQALVQSLSRTKLSFKTLKPLPTTRGAGDAVFVIDKFREYPGIGMGEEIDDKDKTHTINFFITDPILASSSVPELADFLLAQSRAFAEKTIYFSTQGATRIRNALMDALVNPAGAKMEFPIASLDFLRAGVTDSGVKITKVIDTTTIIPKEKGNEALFMYLAGNNHLFKALKFERNGQQLKVKERLAPYLKYDAEQLEDLLARYVILSAERDAAFSALLAAEEEAAKSAKSSKKPAAPQKTAAKSAAAAAPKPAPPPPPKPAATPGQDPAKHWTKFDDFCQKNQAKLLSQFEASGLEIVKGDGNILMNFTGTNPENWLVKSLFSRALPAQYETNFNQETSSFSINYKFPGKDVPSSLGTLRSFLDNDLVKAVKPKAPRIPKAATSAPAPVAASSPAAEEELQIASPPPIQVIAKSSATGSTRPVVVVDAIPVKDTEKAEEYLVPVSTAASVQDALTLKETAATAELNAQTKEFLHTRARYPTFTPYFGTVLPTRIANVAESFRADSNIMQFAIYGSFMFSQKPNDLDLQVVVRDGFIAGKSDEEMREFLGKLFPDVRVGIEKHINPRTKRAVWKVEAGDLVELTFVENRDHVVNQNWVSNIDASVFDLKSGSFAFQPSFVTAIEAKTGVTFGAVPMPNIVNHRAKNWPLRLIHQVRPALLTPEYTMLAAHYFMQEFAVPEAEVTFGAAPKTFVQRLEERAADFTKKHKMDSVESDTFYHNIHAICTAARGIEMAQTEAADSSRVGVAAGSSAKAKPPTTAPHPEKEKTSRVAKGRSAHQKHSS